MAIGDAQDPLRGLDPQVRNQLTRLNERLDRRYRQHRRLESYSEGEAPLPEAVRRAKVVKSYRMLMGTADAPWGSLITGSTQDRLEIAGLTDPEDQKVADGCMELWQNNQMDLESKVAHSSVLVDGRAGVLVWREPGSEWPEVTLDNMGTMAVEFEEGSRRKRTGALRRWMGEDDRARCTLYRADFVYKFIGPKNSSGFAGTRWEPRRDDANDEEDNWPLENPYRVVPAVELAINRKLRPGRFPYARGEYEHCTDLIDRIHLLTFLGLVVAFWMGFPLRGVIGERVLKDDEGNVIPPFNSNAGGLFQLEDPEAKIAEYAAADRDNLQVFPELDQLSSITKTPRHYFPMKGGMQNLSADAIRASEGALHAKVSDYKPSLGEGWEETNRLLGLMSDEKLELSPRAELQWKDHESRSLAERADAAGKLKDILPGVAIATRVLNFSQDEWRAWEAESAGNAIGQIAAAIANPPEAPAPEPAPAPTNGGPPVGVPAG